MASGQLSTKAGQPRWNLKCFKAPANSEFLQMHQFVFGQGLFIVDSHQCAIGF
ncbi:hypothetical protein BKA67DRAFT_576076 [Truncatella angustata]|uniref:Uncharacterized protein n=1 Tax=Truncatella angustata TaxID=152316 RepID=A0A9P8UFD6_9PEZI|nr:uncharacterized protein BKA67DRAFT_576076 [Truncatella angustata]KAH6648865.1 hypothetical protein BKA67DRAFT_576076 [Truncatella angustata]